MPDLAASAASTDELSALDTKVGPVLSLYEYCMSSARSRTYSMTTHRETVSRTVSKSDLSPKTRTPPAHVDQEP